MHSEDLDQQVWVAENTMYRDPFCLPQAGREKDKKEGEAMTAGNSKGFLAMCIRKVNHFQHSSIKKKKKNQAKKSTSKQTNKKPPRIFY